MTDLKNKWAHALLEWQPIETAPKDGENVIVTDGDEVNVGWWEFYNPEPEWGGYILFPTHWMPLPPPPANWGK
ncbi:MAG: hypothetical protein EB015_12325 [Methylocystaceae bacterium]|nr:hypothetical protein [Methylocystaceae bacterium]